MESLTETLWDVVICGTGLQQSLLALALSRSGKKVLHVDPNEYYGGPEAALSLQEADAWAARHQAASADAASSAVPVFSHAEVSRPAESADGASAASRLSFARAYSLALCPQVVHARSDLLAQLVSSRAYRQLEFLAAGSFFVLRHAPSAADTAAPSYSLNRIPSTREEVFTSTTLPARAKRGLMKFLKFVLAYDSEEERPTWEPEYADAPLARFLENKFGVLDAELRAMIVALTLSLDGDRVRTADGLAAIHTALTSMGVFGPGFAAVYPKWGGLSEIAQVACRAGAVGGAIYMLGMGVEKVEAKPEVEADAAGEESRGLLQVRLANGTDIRARTFVQGSNTSDSATTARVSRLVAVVDSPLKPLFEVVVEGAPTPAVAVIACPAGTVEAATSSEHSIFAMAHSSDCGECPVGQSVLYLSTLATPDSKKNLQDALREILVASVPDKPPECLYQLYFEQARRSGDANSKERVFTFGLPSTALSFEDSILQPVRDAWDLVMGSSAEHDGPEYMVFPDREGVGDDDDVYD